MCLLCRPSASLLLFCLLTHFSRCPRFCSPRSRQRSSVPTASGSGELLPPTDVAPAFARFACCASCCFKLRLWLWFSIDSAERCHPTLGRASARLPTRPTVRLLLVWCAGHCRVLAARANCSLYPHLDSHVFCLLRSVRQRQRIPDPPRSEGESSISLFCPSRSVLAPCFWVLVSAHIADCCVRVRPRERHHAPRHCVVAPSGSRTQQPHPALHAGSRRVGP